MAGGYHRRQRANRFGENLDPASHRELLSLSTGGLLGFSSLPLAGRQHLGRRGAERHHLPLARAFLGGIEVVESRQKTP